MNINKTFFSIIQLCLAYVVGGSVLDEEGED